MGDEGWPILGRDRNWRDLVSLSKALAGLEEIRQLRVYADVRDDAELEKDIQDFCRKVMA